MTILVFLFREGVASICKILPIQKKLANKLSDGKVDIEETDGEEELKLKDN